MLYVLLDRVKKKKGFRRSLCCKELFLLCHTKHQSEQTVCVLENFAASLLIVPLIRVCEVSEKSSKSRFPLKDSVKARAQDSQVCQTGLCCLHYQTQWKQAVIQDDQQHRVGFPPCQLLCSRQNLSQVAKRACACLPVFQRSAQHRTASPRSMCGNAFFHRTTNVAGKIGPDNWPVVRSDFPWPVVRSDFPGYICSPMEKRVPTKTIWEAVGSWFPALRMRFFARALRALASHGSGLTWLWQMTMCA